MLPVRFDPPAAKYLKKLKDKKLKKLYQDAVDKIREDCTIGETKTGDLTGFYGYDIYYNKTNYELAYTIERIDGELVVVVMAGTRENFYDELKQHQLPPSASSGCPSSISTCLTSSLILSGTSLIDFLPLMISAA